MVVGECKKSSEPYRRVSRSLHHNHLAHLLLAFCVSGDVVAEAIF
jgi:hypothetical protein